MRIESDAMGEIPVPEEALYGAATARARLNFAISPLRLPDCFIAALGLIKAAAARSNAALGLLPEPLAAAIAQAAEEVWAGRWREHFPVDVFQTGSGTSTNMNANEVIANRALELMGGCRGDRRGVHPNDHVNLCQSSNDVFPSALHIAAALELEKNLVPALQRLIDELERKAEQWRDYCKAGRTHLQDAVPIFLGQEFGGYAALVGGDRRRLVETAADLLALPLGGTAVGTGLNAHPDFAGRTIADINAKTGLAFYEAENHFEAQMSRQAVVAVSAQLRTLAGGLAKIADDVRWLASGPRCGLGELQLPVLQPGSSIMPGKVNPVICEAVMMVAAQVWGSDACVALAGQRGNFELNVMMPVMAYNVLQSIALLSKACESLTDKCLTGAQADWDCCRRYAENTAALATALVPLLGYDNAAAAVKLAAQENISIQAAAVRVVGGREAEIAAALDITKMAAGCPRVSGPSCHSNKQKKPPPFFE